MKKLFIGLLTLASLSVFAQDLECHLKLTDQVTNESSGESNIYIDEIIKVKIQNESDNLPYTTTTFRGELDNKEYYLVLEAIKKSNKSVEISTYIFDDLEHVKYKYGTGAAEFSFRSVLLHGSKEVQNLVVFNGRKSNARLICTRL